MYNVYITSLSFQGEAKKKKNKNKERDNTASHSFSRFQMKRRQMDTQENGHENLMHAHIHLSLCPSNESDTQCAPRVPSRSRQHRSLALLSALAAHLHVGKAHSRVSKDLSSCSARTSAGSPIAANSRYLLHSL